MMTAIKLTEQYQIKDNVTINIAEIGGHIFTIFYEIKDKGLYQYTEIYFNTLKGALKAFDDLMKKAPIKKEIEQIIENKDNIYLV